MTSRAPRFGAREVIAPGAGMRVDEAERRRLASEVDEDARQNRVLDDVGEIAGMEGVAIVHRPILATGSAKRSDGDRIAPAAVPRDLRAGREGLEVFRYAEAHVDELAARAGDGDVVGPQVGVGVDEGLPDLIRGYAPPGPHALERLRDDELVADIADGGEIIGGVEPGAGPVLAVLVGREAVRRIEAVRRCEIGGRKIRVRIAVRRIGTEAIVGPEAVNHEAVAGTDRALSR